MHCLINFAWNLELPTQRHGTCLRGNTQDALTRLGCLLMPEPGWWQTVNIKAGTELTGRPGRMYKAIKHI